MAGNATVKDRRKSKPRIAGSRHVHAGSRSSSDTSLRADPWRELEELKQENASLRIRNEELTQENTDLRKVVDTLTESVNCLKKALSDFTCRSEELAQDSENQKLLLQEELNEARRRLNQNSSNSSMPPSSDGYRKPARKGTRSLRGNSGRNPGGQNGHTGRTLRQVEHPDSVVDHDPEFCSRCGAHLSEEHRICHSSRQVFDLQDGRLTVTEHRAYSSECPHCHEETAAEFPEDVTAPVQYGPTLCGHIVALHVVIQIPINKIIAVMNYFFNVKLSQGTVVRVCRKKAVLLKKVVDVLERKICKESRIKHLDETGCPVSGKLHWLHVASTGKLTCFRVRRTRGEVFDNLRGIVVHDHFSSYFKIEEIEHVVCNAHHLRELYSIIENNPEEVWADQLVKLLLEALDRARLRNEGNGAISKAEILDFQDRYCSILGDGIRYHESLPELKSKRQGRKKRRVGHNLALRLLNRMDATLRFLKDPDVPFTNNLSERDLRMIKSRLGVSGCFRTFQGAVDYATLRSVVSTAKKLGWDMIETLSSSVHALISKLQTV